MMVGFILKFLMLLHTYANWLVKYASFMLILCKIKMWACVKFIVGVCVDVPQTREWFLDVSAWGYERMSIVLG